MTIIRVSPNPPTPVNPKVDIRNGEATLAQVYNRVGRGLNHIIAHQRKLLWLHPGSFDNESVTGTAETTWRGYFRTGPGSTTAGDLQVAITTVLRSTKKTEAGSSYVQWHVKEVGGSETTLDKVIIDERGGSGYRVFMQRMNVSPNTEYEIRMDEAESVRPVSAMVYEEHVRSLDTTTTGVTDTSPMTGGNVIVTDHMAALKDNSETIFNQSGSVLFSWTQRDDSSAPSRTSATAANMFDQTVTAYNSSAPGFKCQARYHNFRHTDDVDIVFAAYLEETTPANTLPASATVELRNSAGTVCSITSFTDGGEWKTATGVIDGSTDFDKLDVLFKSDGVTSVSLRAVVAYEYRS